MKIEDMTMRDYFAAKASEEDIKAQADAIRSSSTLGILPDGWLAVARYMHADAMLAARGQEKTNQCGETCERAKLCAVCAAPLEQATPDQDGWIEWNGGRRPVGQYELVSVKTRGGGCALREKAICFRWNHADHPEDIIAYRVVKGGAA